MQSVIIIILGMSRLKEQLNHQNKSLSELFTIKLKKFVFTLHVDTGCVKLEHFFFSHKIAKVNSKKKQICIR